MFYSCRKPLIYSHYCSCICIIAEQQVVLSKHNTLFVCLLYNFMLFTHFLKFTHLNEIFSYIC